MLGAAWVSPAEGEGEGMLRVKVKGCRQGRCHRPARGPACSLLSPWLQAPREEELQVAVELVPPHVFS